MKTRLVTTFTAASLLGLGGIAVAQEPAAAPTGEVRGARSDPSRARLVTPHGAAITLGAGTTHFFREAARDLTDGPGAYLDLRGAYGTRSWIGAEAAYTISARGLSERRYDVETPGLFGHGAEAMVRGNVPLNVGKLFLSPFAVAGLGWTAFVRTDEAGGEHDLHIRNTDHVGTVPMGAGFALAYGRFYGEARFMYRPTWGADGLTTTAGKSVDLQNWTAGLALGVEF